MQLKLKFKHYWVTLASIIWLVLWLALINPRTSPPVLLLVPFVLIVFLLHRFVAWLVRNFSGGNGLSRRQTVLAWLASLLVGLALVLSSLGQLGLREGITLVAIGAISLVYVVRLVPDRHP